LDRASPKYGFITSTPKPGWENTDLLGGVSSALGVRVAIDTDVNVAALGEWTWGATAGLTSSLYMTIGTGIGGGLLTAGHALRGLHHPEMGHIRIPHDRTRDPFDGSCPYHGPCFEGLASGSAIQRRFGTRAEELADDHPFWELEAEYIANALATLILILSPGRIVLGGGVMQRSFLLGRIRRKTLHLLANYVQIAALQGELDTYIVPPALGDRSGTYGALALATRLGRDQNGGAAAAPPQ
jgi:fructokinase